MEYKIIEVREINEDYVDQKLALRRPEGGFLELGTVYAVEVMPYKVILHTVEQPDPITLDRNYGEEIALVLDN